MRHQATFPKPLLDFSPLAATRTMPDHASQHSSHALDVARNSLAAHPSTSDRAKKSVTRVQPNPCQQQIVVLLEFFNVDAPALCP